MDSWKDYSFTITGATQSTVLELSSSSTTAGKYSGKPDNRFFIDDVIISVSGTPGPQSDSLELTFDFSTCPNGWPQGKDSYESKDHTEQTHEFVLKDVSYYFTTATCLEIAATSKRAIVWGFDGTNEQPYFVMQAQRFFGLPAIKGMKLATVKFIQACSTNTGRKAYITSAITKQNEQETASVEGGGSKDVGTCGTEYTFNLTSTAENTRYYLTPVGKASGFATLTLVYKKTTN